jgi:ABC-2 type transport system ATP-binding protein
VSGVYNALCRRLFGVQVQDLNSVKAWRREIMPAMPLRPDWHRSVGRWSGAMPAMRSSSARHPVTRPTGSSRSTRRRPVLEVIDLVKRYGPVAALDGASFTAQPGRIVGFLGPNGAGKTTTMRCVFGLAHQDRGEVRWDGRPVDRAARLRFGYMPEQRGLYPRMRVAEQLSYFAQQHGLDGRSARAAAARWLERMGLSDRAKSKLEELSHGNQQRVQLATALAHDPALLVLDEPFSGLDPIGIATMTEVVQERAAAGVGVVFSSHQLDLVEDVCEDVVIIAAGRIVAAGAIDELKARSGRRHLEVEVVGSGGSWLQDAGTTTVHEHSGDRLKLLVDETVDLDRLLAMATAAGEVRRFAYQPPRLSELFMEAIAPAPPADGNPR